jgi:hypothetical protein
MVYFENTFRWSFFYHNLKMHGPSCKIGITIFTVKDYTSDDVIKDNLVVAFLLNSQFNAVCMLTAAVDTIITTSYN